ncbi:protocadherin-9-like [Haliotis rufescens]|uniref:protocadherin-9-like n=1 Tax=Haliotis rufescens TaxID=6454 RepID=UPI00201EA435|nr:protocadherin-9-like [Haliotis rufescens]
MDVSILKKILFIGLLSVSRIYAATTSAPNPVIDPFVVVNLHEDTQIETLLTTVTCTDNGVGSTGTCTTCNIVREQPSGAPFRCWKKYTYSEFNVYYVAGQANSALSYRNIAKSYFLDIQCVAADGSTDTQTLEVDIQPNQAPFITDFPGVSRTLDASITAVDTTIYTLLVRDNESDPLTYTMYTEPTVDYFQIDTNTGIISTAKDLKTAVEPVVAIKVNVTDGTNIVGPFTITTTINNLNTRPSFTNLPTNITIYETAASGERLIRLTTTDPDIYNTLTPVFTVNPGTDQYKFSYEQGSGYLRLSTTATGQNVLDAETTSYYNISFLVNDGYLDSVGQYINLFVLNVNEPPQFNEAIFYCNIYESQVYASFCDLGLTVTDPESDTITDIFLLSGNNSERFRYDDANKRFGFNTEYDIDNGVYPNTAVLTIAAVDSNAATGTSQVQVTILDQNDNTPTFANTLSAFSISEGLALGSLGSITATDGDLTSPNNAVTYSQVGGSSALLPYVTVLSSGEVRYTNTFDSSLHGTTYFALVEAKDGGTPQRSSTGTVAVSFVTTTSTTTTTTTTTTATTTTATTTTTQAPGYFDEPANVAIFTCFMIILFIALFIGLYFLYRWYTTGHCCGQSSVKRKRVEPYDEYGNKRDRDPIYDDDDYYVYDRPASTSYVKIGGVNNVRALPSPKPRF